MSHCGTEETRLSLKSRSPAESTAASCRRGTRRRPGPCSGARLALDRGGPSRTTSSWSGRLPPNGHPPPKDVSRTCKLFRIVRRFNVRLHVWRLPGVRKTSLALNGSLWRRLSPLVCAFFLAPFRLSHPATLRRCCLARPSRPACRGEPIMARSGRGSAPSLYFAIAVEHPSGLPGIARLPTNSRADRWRLREARRLRRGRGKTLLVVRVDLLCLIAGGERQREHLAADPLRDVGRQVERGAADNGIDRRVDEGLAGAVVAIDRDRRRLRRTDQRPVALQAEAQGDGRFLTPSGGRQQEVMAAPT